MSALGSGISANNSLRRLTKSSQTQEEKGEIDGAINSEGLWVTGNLFAEGESTPLMSRQCSGEGNRGGMQFTHPGKWIFRGNQ